jgi:hypothetical protein
MSAKRAISIVISLVFSLLVITGTSCKSRKSVCDSNKQSKTMKMKKNKSSYNVKYDFKSKPVKKAYVIRNGR